MKVYKLILPAMVLLSSLIGFLSYNSGFEDGAEFATGECAKTVSEVKDICIGSIKEIKNEFFKGEIVHLWGKEAP